MTVTAPRNQRPAADWSVAVMGGVLGGGNVLLGALILLTDWTQRLSGSSFTLIVHIAPGWVWGAAWVSAGLLALYGQVAERVWPARVGHSAAATLALFWTLAFTVGAFHHPNVAPTGIAAYLTIAVLHIVASVTAPHDRRRQR